MFERSLKYLLIVVVALPFVAPAFAVVDAPAMVTISAGPLTQGSLTGLPNERPVVERELAAFRLDRTPTTVAAFRNFVEASQYRPTSEKFGDGAVFNVSTGQWSLVKGANWRRPLGEQSPEAPDDHPVTQVSWHDAVAFCEHYGKRLPTEAEWEHAAKNARNQTAPYAFGDKLLREGEFLANVWNGKFPQRNTVLDGFLLTSPVGHFGKTELGLTDMAGNVWEWSADWYLPYDVDQAKFEPNAQSEKTLRGGSFLCDEDVCHGYRTTSRSHSTPETTLLHTGFRCAADL